MALEQEEKDSRRDLLEEAWDKAEKDDEQDSGVIGAKPAEGAAEGGEKGETPPAGDDESGKAELEGKAGEGGKEKGAGKKEQPDPDKQERKAAADPNDKSGKAKPVVVAEKAPRSWTPAEREHWAAIPKEVRERIHTRELQIQQELTQTANIRKFAQEFANVINPFSHIIRAQNSTPLKAIQNVMATSAGLFQGSAQQKAEIVANVIGTYGVDLQLLDTLLANMQKNGGIKPPAGVTRPEAPPQWAKPLFDFMGTAEQARQQHQEQVRAAANAEVEGFDKPFFDDLREEMADLLEVSAQRGRLMTMEQAYERAVALNPEISKIIEQKKAAEKAKSGDPTAARRAASTIRGAPTGNAAAGAGKGAKASRREAIASAWDDAAS